MARSKAIKQEESQFLDDNRDRKRIRLSEEETPKPSPSNFKDSLQRFHYSGPTASEAPTRTLRSASRAAPPPAVLPSFSFPEPHSHTSSPTTSPPPTLNPTPQKKKKRARKPSKYAPPSTYAHLPPLPDLLGPSLLTLFIGSNPGLATALTSHAYAHPSNLFYKLLHSSHCTDRRLQPSEDGLLPTVYSLGSTNLVARATRDVGELGKGELSEGWRALEGKVRLWRPESVCCVGKGVWEGMWRGRYGRGMRKGEFRWGWQDEGENVGRGRLAGRVGKREGSGGEVGVKNEGTEDGEDDEGDYWVGARVFVACSTSGLSASLRPAEKEAIWKPFGEWIVKRRAERKIEAERKMKADVADTVKDESGREDDCHAGSKEDETQTA